MLEFIQLLKQRYQTVSEQIKSDTVKSVYQQRIDQQILAEAFIRKGDLLAASADLPLQIAVVGPTQAGKSTLVNLLLNSQDAGVSPLAGYTVHSQGFCNGFGVDDCSGLQQFFGRFQQLHPAQLSKERYDCYALAENSGRSKLLPDCVLWDTPDFDSIDASGYSEALIRTIALADIIVLVVSKEKYADQSVWDLMTSIQALQQPTLICVNKLIEGAESIIIQSLKQKWQQSRSDGFPSVIPLLYQKQQASPSPAWPESEASIFSSLVRQVKRRKHGQRLQDYLSQHWQPWLEPVVAEHQALNEWCTLIDDLIKQALSLYQRDYLEHPHHYETFQNAMASLLNLLEIPGLAKVLVNTRKVLTWPVKQLFSLGARKTRLADSSHEVALLNHLAEHLLIQLADRLLDKAEQSDGSQWWKGAMSVLRQQRQSLLAEFNAAANRYHDDFQQEVDAAAFRLYDRLQQQPVVLNSLRATRVTTDAAAVALTLHAGGIGLHDLIITPAMLSVTSLLTESAIGSYVNKVEADLKQHQLQTVKQSLLIDHLQRALYLIPTQLSYDTYFNISPDRLQAVEQQLKHKPHGLRLL
ncbi:MAG: GTPase [Gammaproteobacteria bacterium]